MALTDTVSTLKGVGTAKKELLDKLGIHTLEELISYFPRQYEDRTGFLPISGLEADTPACFEATIVTPPRTSHIRKGLNVTRCTVSDNSASVHITWFNQPWMSKTLQVGRRYCFYGTLAGDDRRHEILNPVAEAMDAPPSATRCIIPIYPLTGGLTSRALQHLIFQALEQETLPDILPAALTAGMPPLKEAYQEVHRPTTAQRLKEARRRLVFEEFFLFSVGLGQMKHHRDIQSNYPCPKPAPTRFFDGLSFSLTNAQSRALSEISADLASGAPMHRLLQGDVGSGKTMVALAAMLQTAENGYQAALMAPTELLATQHYHTVSKLLEPLGIQCALLSGSMPAAARRRTLDCVATGAAKIVIGTHALLTDTTDFYNLGLAVIDEQHRFGVRQRAALRAKGNAPHLLVLSATPIPRTLALILYGDLDISVIDELPPGRKKVDTFLVPGSYRLRLQGFIRKQVREGHQVYVVCPSIEENQDTGLASAEETCAALQKALPDLRIGLVHSKMRSDARDRAMRAFLQRETDILVSTTVIEVGVDVPNATLMIVENADRFGLSQLHQLRGRVGRSDAQSYCVLVSDNRSADTRKRLKTMCGTNDGFEIARQDLDLRGPGDFFGCRQSGLPMFHMASLADDLSVLKEAQQTAEDFLSKAPDPNAPENRQLFQHVSKLFSEIGDTFN